jgi:hypothetical protein
MSSIISFYYNIMGCIMLLIAIVISTFVHRHVNSKRLSSSAVYLFVQYVLQHRKVWCILRNQRLQAIPIRSQRMKFYDT